MPHYGTYPPARILPHAIRRIQERISLTAEEIKGILDTDRAVSVGREDGRVHRIFFSKPDKHYFEAVQDEKNGDVITILSATWGRIQGYNPGFTMSEARKLVS